MECLGEVTQKVIEEMNIKLQQRFTREEVEEALKCMAPLKSLGPDGFGACVYQSYWVLVGDEVSKVILDFLNKDSFQRSLNATYIVLITKIEHLERVGDFRHISLCNVLYKIILKTLANRLKLILPEVISYNQSAFIPKRLITDNVIAAYEVLHSRDAEGEILVTMCRPQVHVKLPIISELDALWRGLALCMEIGLNEVVFEGDSHAVVWEVKCAAENHSEYGQMVEDIKEVLRSKPSWQIQYTPREGNNVVHRLAKFALNCEDERVLVKESPYILNLVMLEKQVFV